MKENIVYCFDFALIKNIVVCHQRPFLLKLIQGQYFVVTNFLSKKKKKTFTFNEIHEFQIMGIGKAIAYIDFKMKYKKLLEKTLFIKSSHSTLYLLTNLPWSLEKSTFTLSSSQSFKCLVKQGFRWPPPIS